MNKEIKTSKMLNVISKVTQLGKGKTNIRNKPLDTKGYSLYHAAFHVINKPSSEFFS